MTIALFFGAGLANAGGAKTMICHLSQDEPGKFTTNVVSGSSLLKHLDHGDLLGACDSHAAALCDDNDLCTVDVIDPDTHQCDNSGAVVCNDQILCTADACVPDQGCVSTVTCPAETPVCDPSAPSGTECTGTAGDCPLQLIADVNGWDKRGVLTTACEHDFVGATIKNRETRAQGAGDCFGEFPCQDPECCFEACDCDLEGDDGRDILISIGNSGQADLLPRATGYVFRAHDGEACTSLLSAPAAADLCLTGVCTTGQTTPPPVP